MGRANKQVASLQQKESQLVCDKSPVATTEHLQGSPWWRTPITRHTALGSLLSPLLPFVLCMSTYPRVPRYSRHFLLQIPRKYCTCGKFVHEVRMRLHPHRREPRCLRPLRRTRIEPRTCEDHHFLARKRTQQSRSRGTQSQCSETTLLKHFLILRVAVEHFKSRRHRCFDFM